MANSNSRETLNAQKLVEMAQDPKLGGKRLYYKDRIADDGYIYTPYITLRDGRIIWHPTGGVFRFLPK